MTGRGIINYKQTIENSPSGFIYADRDLIITHANAKAAEFSVLHRTKLAGEPLEKAFPQLSVLRESPDAQAIRKVRFGDRDLLVRMFSVDSPVKPEETGFVIVLHDFYDEFLLAAELAQTSGALEELKDIVDNFFDGILVTDGDGNVLLFNQAYLKNTGIDSGLLVGHNIKELINPVWMKTSITVLVAEQRRSVSMHHTTQNNKNLIVTGTPIFGKDGGIKRIIVTCRDMSEIYSLREELLKAKEMERRYFQDMAHSADKSEGGGKLVIVNEKMQQIYSLAKRLGNFTTTVLISGESGVGKEEVARYIHENSLRKNRKFVAVNCGAIPENLLETELFGYVEGAFTGTVKGGKAGLFEIADGGTLFLDEIGEMPLSLQVKLLRALETRSITRVGAVESIPVDIRIVAASNKNLFQKIEEGAFRDDLYYRLNVVNIEIPPLRERVEDIGPLALRFMHRFNKQYNPDGREKKLTLEVIEELEHYGWPGNIRELKNVIENVTVISNNEYIQVDDLPWAKNEPDVGRSSDGLPTMQEVTEAAEKRLLRQAREKLGSSRKIAEALGVDQSTVVRKLKKYGLS